jgi:hypothetical protein
MRSLENLPLDRARVRRDQIERELKKCPDFQLYLITEAPDDRARMEHLLLENPSFKLWRLLTNAIALAGTHRQPIENRAGLTDSSREGVAVSC